MLCSIAVLCTKSTFNYTLSLLKYIKSEFILDRYKDTHNHKVNFTWIHILCSPMWIHLFIHDWKLFNAEHFLYYIYKIRHTKESFVGKEVQRCWNYRENDEVGLCVSLVIFTSNIENEYKKETKTKDPIQWMTTKQIQLKVKLDQNKHPWIDSREIHRKKIEKKIIFDFSKWHLPDTKISQKHVV